MEHPNRKYHATTISTLAPSDVDIVVIIVGCSVTQMSLATLSELSNILDDNPAS